MNPVRMRLTGFLSYNDPAEINFEAINLACISGQNGAGKSSILDGMTWALFGKARGSDESIINSHANAAEVTLEFELEGNHYLVQRSKPRGKTGLLEFFIRSEAGNWRPLTENAMRDTEARIVKTLRLDYETFINASFFLQGKADEFTQKSAGKRKEILSNILGLEDWETYRKQTAIYHRTLDGENNILLGLIKGNEEELNREDEYRRELSELQKELSSIETLFRSKSDSLAIVLQQENLLENLKKSLDEQSVRVRSEQLRLDGLEKRLDERIAERSSYLNLLNTASEIESTHNSWQDKRKELEQWESKAEAFHKLNQARNARQAVIDNRRSALQAEFDSMQTRLMENKAREKQVPDIEQTLTRLKAESDKLAELRQQKAEKTDQLNALKINAAEIETANQSVVRDGSLLEERINRLGEAQEEICPVCKKPLNQNERARMVTELRGDQAKLNAIQQKNNGLLQAKRNQIRLLANELNSLADIENRYHEKQQAITREETRLVEINESIANFNNVHLPRLTELENTLAADVFEPEARTELLRLDTEISTIGYDADLHEAVRVAELAGRKSVDALRQVEKARAALEPLEREIETIESSINAEEQSVKTLIDEKDKSEREYQAAARALPDRSALEREVTDLKIQSNRKRSEVGGAEHRITNLDIIRARQKGHLTKREEYLHQISRLKELERAFGKDGVPALLIEQALPEIEIQANDLLEKLSNGSMSLKFETQSEYKSNKRDDKKETLIIKISDASGSYREYEMYSGGEAFRVNFAIRLALSRVLAHRAGARLQTLVIDEGFGSQDADGRQRLIEAINHVRDDFEKILVITHLDDLKDAFPARIEVEKGASGSTIRVQVL